MGPRPDGHGQLCRFIHVATVTPSLQWGRDLTVTDSRPSKSMMGESIAASMGPRPDGHGQGISVEAYQRVALLQWGRDLTVTDRPDER